MIVWIISGHRTQLYQLLELAYAGLDGLICKRSQSSCLGFVCHPSGQYSTLLLIWPQFGLYSGWKLLYQFSSAC